MRGEHSANAGEGGWCSAAVVVFKTKEGVIEYDAARISPERIVGVINETGFKAEPLNKKGKP